MMIGSSIPPSSRFGLRPDTEDRRDRALYKTVPDINALPDEGGYTELMPLVMDQRVVSGCVGYSGSETAYCVMVKDGHRRPFVPSPVFLYRQARELGGYVEEDAGAEIRNCWKALARWGAPPMSNLKPRFRPGDLSDQTTYVFPENSIWRRRPARSHFADAERRQALVYYKLATLNDLLQCLADGWPAQLGFMVFRSMYGWGGPVFDVPDPGPDDRGLGGHAVMAYRYDKRTERVTCRNSWGEDAHEGRPDFTLSFEYIRRYAWDVWTARVFEGFKPGG
jgi:hypothetical protein